MEEKPDEVENIDEIMASEEKEGYFSFLSFYLKDELYGIDVHTVEQIIRIGKISIVPNSAPSVEGIINLRGKILAVFNLRKMMKLEPIELNDDARILVLDVDNEKVGLIVDKVNDIVFVHRDSIEPPSQVYMGIDLQHVAGIGKMEESFIVLLDVARLFNRGSTGLQ